MHICKLKWDGRSHFNILKSVYAYISICGASTLGREVTVPLLAEDFAFFGFGIESNSLKDCAALLQTKWRRVFHEVRTANSDNLLWDGLYLLFVAFPMFSAISCYLCIGTYILTFVVSQTSCNTSVLKQKYE